MNKRTAIRSIALSAVIAAVYTALTMSLPMLSYGPVQLRFSEALTVLPFFLPEAVPGLFLGCVIANLFSPFGIADVIFGSIATLVGAFFTYKIGYRKPEITTPQYWLAIACPVANAIAC